MDLQFCAGMLGVGGPWIGQFGSLRVVTKLNRNKLVILEQKPKPGLKSEN